MLADYLKSSYCWWGSFGTQGWVISWMLKTKQWRSYLVGRGDRERWLRWHFWRMPLRGLEHSSGSAWCSGAPFLSLDELVGFLCLMGSAFVEPLELREILIRWAHCSRVILKGNTQSWSYSRNGSDRIGPYLETEHFHFCWGFWVKWRRDRFLNESVPR
jgi:hypothetical protein